METEIKRGRNPARLGLFDDGRRMRTIFTTGQVAQICKVAPRTVSKWFDRGELKGYRIPGSTDRRIPRENLIKFMKDYGFPSGELEDEQWFKVLLIGTEKLFNDRIKDMLPEDDWYKYGWVDNSFEAGTLLQSFPADAMIIDMSLGRSEAIQIVRSLRAKETYAKTPIIALAGEDEAEEQLLGYMEYGFTHVFKKPLDMDAVTNHIRQSAELIWKGKK
jgi:two-component system response regulator RpaA